MHDVEDWDVEFYAKVHDDALGAMLSLHLTNTKYATIGKCLVEIREGLLDLGMHQLRMGVHELLSSFHTRCDCMGRVMIETC